MYGLDLTNAHIINSHSLSRSRNDFSIVASTYDRYFHLVRDVHDSMQLYICGFEVIYSTGEI